MKEFIKGMDISFIPQYEEEGKTFANEDGLLMDPFGLAAEYGVNYIRLRIWNQPELVPESGGYCSLDHTIAMAKRIRKAGMGFLLDFHYSDWWADPANQKRPKAWEGLSVRETADALFQYTKDVLDRMKEEGVLPDIVQVGNEIRCGMLYPEGDTNHWENLARFINAGIRAVRAADPAIQVVIHLDQGGRIYYLKEWFEQAASHGVTDFDCIALSYYPFWHGDYAQLKEAMETLHQIFRKPILIAEAAHAWRKTENGFIGELQEKIAGFPLTPAGQEKVLRLVMSINDNLSDGAGMGVFYWEPLSFADSNDGGWGKNMSVLDDSGKAHQGIRSFRYQSGEIDPNAAARVYEPEPCTVSLGKKPVLPEMVKILKWNGETAMVPVCWESGNLETSSVKTVSCKGVADAFDETGNRLETSVTVKVYDPQVQTVNLLSNGGFTGGMSGWQVGFEQGEAVVEVREEPIDPFPLPPVPVLFVKNSGQMIGRIQSGASAEEDGTYCLKMKAVGDNTTGVKVSLSLSSSDREQQTEVFLQSSQWMEYEVALDAKAGEWLSVQIRMEAPPMEMKVREVSLTRMK
ncbi:MAG: glycosyl hydrolase 53 family protein [Lachnospiraceae bacterium]|nr:glycosyl hydrolase 53 family protein [Lachnospiraceae bacterium]